ncbi:MAG: PIN domain-containing protein [Dehalococcoidia bacterium]|nr:PIN domain-containing protein [Dehalococcoidia bacterium]
MTQLPITPRERAVLVDTSAFYARMDMNDQWYQKALQGFNQLVQERRPAYTTNLVVAETYTLALGRLGYSMAQQWLEALYPINLVFQRQEHYSVVQKTLERYSGRGFSYTDVFSFVAMEEIGIRTAFAFDRHFQEYGWDLFPTPLT